MEGEKNEREDDKGGRREEVGISRGDKWRRSKDQERGTKVREGG